eukprot:m.148187 g.148187  ORF g.148187 m.148187 type:complete len:112 (-) comp30578_c1_seq1:267-602(-)
MGIALLVVVWQTVSVVVVSVNLFAPHHVAGDGRCLCRHDVVDYVDRNVRDRDVVEIVIAIVHGGNGNEIVLDHHLDGQANIHDVEVGRSVFVVEQHHVSMTGRVYVWKIQQ